MNITEFILPPLIGAAIGYITNYIAIKMLFKPYNKYKLLNITMPFTPGIIPKNKGEFARNIGQLVSKHLLTKETLQRKITSKTFILTIEQIVKNILRKILDFHIKTIISLVPQKLQEIFKNYYNIAKNKLYQKYKTFVKSTDFENLVYLFTEKAVANISKKQIQDVISKDSINYVLNEILNPLIKEQANNKIVHSFLKEKISLFIKSDKKINELIPSSMIAFAKDSISSSIPSMINETQNAVFEFKLDHKLYDILKDMIITYVEKSGTLVQFFSSALLLEDWIEENLHDLTRQFIHRGFDELREEKNKQEMQGILLDKIDKLLDKPISELSLSKDTAIIESDIVNYIQGYLTNDEFLGGIHKIITSSFDAIKERPINSIIKDKDNQISSTLSDTIISVLRQDDIIKQSISKVDAMLDRLVYEKEIGKLNKIIDITAQQESTLSTAISSQIISLTENNLSGIIERIDLETLVISKVNEFPIEKVEGILLSIIRKHLKWINIFGAVLGAMLGAAQVIYLLTKS